MSPPYIADGTYNIRNYQYSDSVIALNGGGLPFAALISWPILSDPLSPNLRWIVKNVGHNQITIENVNVRGYYMTADYFHKGAPCFASPNPTYWTVNEVIKGVYVLAAGDHMLALYRGGEFVSISLAITDAYVGTQQAWTFERVGN